LLGQDPMGGALYVFVSKSATRVKVLWWDRNGYCLLYKRLHRSLFVMPEAAAGVSSVHIDGPALAQLLAGVATEEKRRSRALTDSA
jgi:transposase